MNRKYTSVLEVGFVAFLVVAAVVVALVATDGTTVPGAGTSGPAAIGQSNTGTGS